MLATYLFDLNIEKCVCGVKKEKDLVMSENYIMIAVNFHL